ncbi:MAG: membrane protein insertase YidC [Verrucomicrobia bacterium]|nr:membrane protein insertase YidC [Verrucomicrobiota bacterium]
MKKSDFIIVGVLVALMFAWMNFYPALEQKFFPKPVQPVTQAAPAATNTPAVSAPVEKKAVIAGAVAAKAPEVVRPSVPEQTMTLANDNIELTVSSYGGAVISAVLKKYPAENRKDSGPAVLDFSAAPALRYAGLPVPAGVLEKTADGLRYVAALGDGRFFERSFKLDGEYLLKVEDSFANSGTAPWTWPSLRLPTGPMAEAKGTTTMQGLITLGVDSFTPAEGVHHWGKELNKLFRDTAETGLVTTTAEQIAPRSVDWVAAKNKFFVQVLTPKTSAYAFDLSVRKEGEGKKNIPVEVAAALQFDSKVVAANETLVRETSAYIGPKDYGFLKTQGMDQVEVMEFRSMGFWKFMNPIMYPMKTGLLWGLKALHVVVRNYGVAIMLLTVIVRMIFWPITHKGTESMRRMQALQPQLKEIQAKYKDNPQRAQQEVMKFYKENKVNPLGGCLPMLIQIPVFIALFVVLRSAVELRFSKFLWIRDLSEPEHLFAGLIPVVGSLNILPILMAATMVWQQKLTPAAGDPQQQKMMAILMPIMMLFFFYTMPSGLVLYWTTSNLIMIIQMLIKKQKPV